MHSSSFESCAFFETGLSFINRFVFEKSIVRQDKGGSTELTANFDFLTLTKAGFACTSSGLRL